MNQIPESLRPGKHRVHHAYIWLGGLYAAFIVFVSVGFSVAGSIAPELMGEGMPTNILIIVLALSFGAGLLIVGFIFLIQWLAWKNLSYELSETEFNLYSGIISKKRRHLPYQRVQAVNQSAGVLQRILGLCNVQIDTAGGEANEAVSLKYIRNSDAEALRSELFRRKKILLADGRLDANGNAFVAGTVIPSAWTLACYGGNAYAALVDLGLSPEQASQAVSSAYQPAPASPAAPQQPGEGNILDAADEILTDVRGIFGGQEVHTGEVSYQTGLSNKELFMAGISGAADYLGILAAGLIGVSALVMPAISGMVESWMEDSLNSLISVEVDGVATAVSFAAWHMVLWAVAGLVVMWLLSALGTMIKYGGFKARRRETRIEVEHGLLKRTFSGVDVDRVQSVIIDQGLITRLLGYCELRVAKIDSLAASEEGGSNASMGHGVVLHPFVKLSRVPEILNGMLPEFSSVPQETVKPARVALRRAIVRKALIRSSMFWIFLVAVALHAALLTAGVDFLSATERSILQGVLMVAEALFMVTALVHVVDAVLWHKRSGLGYNREFVSLTDGGLTVKTLVFPRKKIQFAFTRTNPFQRMAHVQTIAVTTAAGVTGTTEALWDISEEDADAFLEWVKPRIS